MIPRRPHTSRTTASALVLCVAAFAAASCEDDPSPSTMSLTDSVQVSFAQDGPDARDGSVASDGSDGSGESIGCESALLETFAISGAAHVAQPRYTDPPPVGGDHLDCWADYGVHAQPVDPGNWVHNLEHGAVVLLHDCGDGCEGELGQLEVFAKAHARIVMTPYGGLPTRFAAVAWGRRLTMDCLHMPTVEAFYADFFDRAPESVASGPPPGCWTENR